MTALSMTALECALKDCLALRPDLQNRVLTQDEMQAYYVWLSENFGDRAQAVLSKSDLPPMLNTMAELGTELFSDAASTRLSRLSGLFDRHQSETHFFTESYDISAGTFLRYMPPYWREDDYFEVYYAQSGETPVFFSEETVTLRPGEVLLIPPRVKKACMLPADDCSAHFCMIRKSTFSKVFWSHLTLQNPMSKFFRNALGGSTDTPYLLFSTGEDAWVAELFLQILSVYRSAAPYTPELLNALMSAFFLSLLQGYENTLRISAHSALRWKPVYADFLRYLQEHFAAVTLSELCARFGYSERQMIRILKDSTGETFSRLQTRLRMERAAVLLSNGHSASAVAAEVGFENLSAFYRAYARYYGHSTKQGNKM